MPHLTIILNTEQHPYAALEALTQRTGITDADKLVDEGHLIYLTNDSSPAVGVLPSGMESGAPAVSICIPLPDGRVVLQETSLALFLSAADAFRAAYGDPR